MLKLSIIIVNYEVPYFLEQCMLSVMAASENIASEIIVVDNNSKDGSCAMIREKFPEVKLLENDMNLGFAKAMNKGVANSKGAYVLILNPDTIIAEDCFDELIEFAEKQKKFGALGVKFIDGTGNFLPECKRNIPTLKIANQKIIGNSKNYYANHIDKNAIDKVEILTGAFMLMKREVYLKVKGFDEDYFMFGEDIDLSYRLLKNGFENYYYGKSTVIHYKGESTIKDVTYLKNFYGAMHIFYRKHYKVSALMNFVSEIAVKILVSLKSLSNTGHIEHPHKVNNFLFISDQESIFKKLKNKINTFGAEMRLALPDDLSPYDLIIFDNGYMSNKEIIKNIEHLKLFKISKRIIPKNTSFYIGSDAAFLRGEAVVF